MQSCNKKSCQPIMFLRLFYVFYIWLQQLLFSRFVYVLFCFSLKIGSLDIMVDLDLDLGFLVFYDAFWERYSDKYCKVADVTG